MCKKLDLSTLIDAIDTKVSGVSVETKIVFTKGYQAGIVVSLDSKTDPKNFIVAYIRITGSTYKLLVDKYIDGVRSNLETTNITYVSGYKLKVTTSEGTIKAYYNDVQIGTDLVAKDISIIYNTIHGLFNTSPLNTFSGTVITEIAPSAATKLATFALASDIHIGYESWLEGELSAMFSTMDLFEDVDFLIEPGDTLDSGYDSTPELQAAQYAQYVAPSAAFTKPIYAYRGNHDVDVDQFLSHGVIEVNGVRLIFFHADYVGLAEPPDYTNTGDVTAAELAWLETQLQVSATHKILVCHWSIVTGDANFPWPITDEHGRLEVLALANTYGVKLYLNGHEHNPILSTGTAGVLTDVNCPTASGTGCFLICTVYADKIVIDMHKSKTPFEYVKSIEVALV